MYNTRALLYCRNIYFCVFHIRKLSRRSNVKRIEVVCDNTRTWRVLRKEKRNLLPTAGSYEDRIRASLIYGLKLGRRFGVIRYSCLQIDIHSLPIIASGTASYLRKCSGGRTVDSKSEIYTHLLIKLIHNSVIKLPSHKPFLTYLLRWDIFLITFFVDN